MTIARRVLALLCSGALVLAVASATSLGTFDDVSLSGFQDAEPTACTVTDTGLDVTFYSGLLGSLVELLLGDLTTTEVTYIELTNLSGDCTGMRPVVTVIGEPTALITDREVLSRTMLGELSGTSDVLLEVSSTADDELDALIGTTATPDEVRVAFCPVHDGVPLCGP